MSKELKVAMKAAKVGAKIVQKHFRNGIEVSYKTRNEIVTAADMESNRQIENVLRAKYPNHKFISEELGADEKLTDEPTWIIDPLDGTSNFAAGLPLYAIAIALVVNREPVVGVIYDPLHKEWFTAEKGKGMELNGRPITKSPEPPERKRLVLTGHSRLDSCETPADRLIASLGCKVSHRRLGTAAIMMASVAVGRADAVILAHLKSWDAAAGALLIQEAGGTITDTDGKPWTLKDVGDLVGSRGMNHADVLKLAE